MQAVHIWALGSCFRPGRSVVSSWQLFQTRPFSCELMAAVSCRPGRSVVSSWQLFQAMQAVHIWAHGRCFMQTRPFSCELMACCFRLPDRDSGEQGETHWQGLTLQPHMLGLQLSSPPGLHPLVPQQSGKKGSLNCSFNSKVKTTVSRDFRSFFCLKDSIWARMNRRKWFCKLIRFREDIRSQSSKIASQHSQQLRWHPNFSLQ